MAAQLQIDLPVRFDKAAYDYGARSSGQTHGVVLTRPHVVSLILDLAGYDPEADLASKRLLEPSCGHGAFLVQAVERLLLSARTHGRASEQLEDAIRAYDIDEAHVAQTRSAVRDALEAHGVHAGVATTLASRWVQVADFLLAAQEGVFDFVVGNPPYVRIEQLAAPLQAEYRRRYASIFDRADLYVAFIEQGLNLLSSDGVLSFICADRWILNKYGAPLRELLTSRFSVRCYVDLHRASPFDSEVIAYPSIFAIGRGRTGAVQVAKLDTASESECDALSSAMRHGDVPRETGASVAVYGTWFQGSEPWVISTPEHLRVLRDLERRFEPIEATAKVGIGVATGSDKVYIVENTVEVEPDRLVPLVMRSDIENGHVKPTSRCVINAFGDDGKVVNLERYPRLERYLHERASEIKRRHVAQKNPSAWFRTIDRVYPELVRTPKLLIPDIAGSNEVVFEPGHYHPHHNLYFVTSTVWDMEVLGGLLSSRVALFFVWSYAVKMRGGYLRFQAQYLRRVRLPDPRTLDAALAAAIKAAFGARDFTQLDALALRAYGLSSLPAFDFVDTRR